MVSTKCPLYISFISHKTRIRQTGQACNLDLGKLRPEDEITLEPSRGYIVSSRPAWRETKEDTCSQAILSTYLCTHVHTHRMRVRETDTADRQRQSLLT